MPRSILLMIRITALNVASIAQNDGEYNYSPVFPRSIQAGATKPLSFRSGAPYQYSRRSGCLRNTAAVDCPGDRSGNWL
jgi:hypothetical protein